MQNMQKNCDKYKQLKDSSLIKKKMVMVMGI